MKRLRQLLDCPAEDRGAALILVMFVVTVIGLAGAALLTFSDTSIRTTTALRDQAGNAYSADGAAKVALENLRTGYGFDSPAMFENDHNTTCFGGPGEGTWSKRNFYPAVDGRTLNAPSSVSVVCEADPDTGVNATVVPITSANRPAQSITTLNRNAPTEDGVNVTPLGTPSTPFAVDTVKSNSTIKVTSGSMQRTGAVTAFLGCTGTITPSATCNTNTNLGDPGYAKETTVVPPYRPVPADVAASCPGGVVTFSPGYYDNAIALTTLMDNTGACAGSTWWFTPGTYYFDFHNNTLDSHVYRLTGSTAIGGAADQWGITSGDLVAGTPTDGNGNVIGSPGASPVMPGSCQSPLRSITNAGVQFIFGGDSRLALGGAANGEICGTYSATKPPIGVYGVSGTTAAAVTNLNTSSTSLKMSTAPIAPIPGLFTNAAQVRLEDNTSATWPKTTSASESSTITVSGYAPPSAPIPAGSIVTAASVRVRHGNSVRYVAADTFAVTVTPKGEAGTAGPSITSAYAPARNTTNLQTNTPILQTSGQPSSVFSQYVHENGLSGADIALAATLTHTGTMSLDAIQIYITFVKPQFRGQRNTTIGSNCMNAVYAGEAGPGCAVLSTSERLPSDPTPYRGVFYVQGTTYTPAAPVDLTLKFAKKPALRLGVISRSLWISQTGLFDYPGSVIGIPVDTSGDNAAPIVHLTVYVCPAISTDTCRADPSAIEALTVKALIDDSTPPRRITILSWSVQR